MTPWLTDEEKVALKGWALAGDRVFPRTAVLSLLDELDHARTGSVDMARIECEEYGFQLALDHEEGQRYTFRLDTDAAEELLNTARRYVGPWVEEREAARSSYSPTRAEVEAELALGVYDNDLGKRIGMQNMLDEGRFG